MLSFLSKLGDSMIGRIINESEYILHVEGIGEEVGFPNVRLVGLYSNHDERFFYWIFN